jgi:geranylgeranyl pyrophosphate synthase
LLVGEELTRRRPGSDLREGAYTLPVAYAIEADPELRDGLSSPLSGADAGAVVVRIRESGGVEQAAAECRRFADRAAEAAAELAAPRGEALIALAGLPAARLEQVLGSPAEAATHG